MLAKRGEHPKDRGYRGTASASNAFIRLKMVMVVFCHSMCRGWERTSHLLAIGYVFAAQMQEILNALTGLEQLRKILAEQVHHLDKVFADLLLMVIANAHNIRSALFGRTRCSSHVLENDALVERNVD